MFRGGQDWLTRYGYLPPPDPVQAQLQSLEKLRDAVKVMQRFAGLPETGLMGRWTPPRPCSPGPSLCIQPASVHLSTGSPNPE